MLNEEKIKVMTDLAVFEKQNGKRMKGVTGFFKRDYISKHLIRGFLSFTVSFGVVFLFWLLFNMDIFLSTAALDGIISIARKTAIFYAIGLVAYSALIWTVYGRRYDTETRKLRIYTAKLKHLDKRYDYHRRARELNREDRGI